VDQRAQPSLIVSPSVGYRRITSVKSCKTAPKVVRNGTLTLNFGRRCSNALVADRKVHGTRITRIAGELTGRGSRGSSNSKKRSAGEPLKNAWIRVP
jgi:hypothetical protein